MSEPNSVSDAKKRILDLLKRNETQTAGQLARHFSLTEVAIRQHLAALQSANLVKSQARAPRGRGRPAILWSLTNTAQELFPNRHAELTVELIQATRSVLGEEAMLRVIDARAADQINKYRREMPREEMPLRLRVEALAKLRTREGYIAEVREQGDGSFLLIEHHCPICEAATCCLGLCASEHRVFQKALGDDALVERTEHLLSDGSRCVYFIRQV